MGFKPHCFDDSVWLKQRSDGTECNHRNDFFPLCGSFPVVVFGFFLLGLKARAFLVLCKPVVPPKTPKKINKNFKNLQRFTFSNEMFQLIRACCPSVVSKVVGRTFLPFASRRAHRQLSGNGFLTLFAVPAHILQRLSVSMSKKIERSLFKCFKKIIIIFLLVAS